MTHHKSIGITGSREGMTGPQKEWLRKWMTGHSASVLNHGHCVGVDEFVALAFKRTSTYIIGHPGSSRAELRSNKIINDLTLPWADNLVRNRLIVDSSSMLLAFSRSMHSLLNSGTWFTIRYATEKKVPKIIVFPDGSTQF